MSKIRWTESAKNDDWTRKKSWNDGSCDVKSTVKTEVSRVCVVVADVLVGARALEYQSTLHTLATSSLQKPLLWYAEMCYVLDARNVVADGL